MNDINIEDIDIEKLRKDLYNYYAGAAYMVNPVAMMDAFEIERLTDEEIVKKALELKIDLTKYIKEKTLY